MKDESPKARPVSLEYQCPRYFGIELYVGGHAHVKTGFQYASNFTPFCMLVRSGYFQGLPVHIGSLQTI